MLAAEIIAIGSELLMPQFRDTNSLYLTEQLNAIGIPVNTCLLERVQHTRTQTLLTRSQRADNVRNAFCVRAKSFLQGQRIVLVDDVLTTGATTSACAKALKAAGAGDVSVWTVARGI